MVESEGGEAGDGAAEVLDRPLPEGVRRRVVQIVSDGFGGLTVAELPPQLRQYARFTPTRRAKFMRQCHGRRRGERHALPPAHR